MRPLDLFMRFQNMRSKKPQGQIAILFIILIALVFVFMAIVMNIGKLTLQKTDLDNATDSAVLLAASDLGSMAQAGKRQTGCHTNVENIIGAIIGTVLSFIPGFNTLGLILLGSSLGSQGLTDYLQNKQWRDMVSNLDEKSQIQEQAIIAALGSIVQDPNTITDVNDFDGDGNTTDQVSEFVRWHYFRIKTLAEGGGSSIVAAAMKAFNCFILGQCFPTGSCSCGGIMNLPKFNVLLTDPGGLPGGYKGYFNNNFSKLMTDLWNIYLSNPTKYAVINQQINRDPPRFWRPGDCATDPNACDSVDDLNDQLAVFSQFILQIQSSLGTSSAWGRVNGLMDLFYGEGDPNICAQFPELCVNGYDVNWHDRAVKWSNWMVDWKARIDTILNSGAFPTAAECRTQCNTLCDGPCQTSAKNACCPNVGNNCCPPSGTTGTGGTCDTEASNYCYDFNGQGSIDCRNNNMYHFDVRYGTGCVYINYCSNMYYQMATGCYDPLNSTKSENCCLDRIVYRYNWEVWHGSCAIPGFCSGGDCQQAYSIWDYYPCIQKCYYGPNGNDGKYQQCVNRETNTCKSQASAQCSAGSFTNQCFQDAYNACYPGAYQSCYNNCYGPCYNACYNPIRNDLILASTRLSNFLNEVNSLLASMEQAKAATEIATEELESLPQEAIYGWKDSLGWHLVMTKVSSFNLPRLYHYTENFGFTNCAGLTDDTGNVIVETWRYDQAKQTKFAGKADVPMWKFRYGKKGEDIAASALPFNMDDPNLKNWMDLQLLDKNSANYVSIKDFLTQHGLRTAAEAHFGPEQRDIYITRVNWSNLQ